MALTMPKINKVSAALIAMLRDSGMIWYSSILMQWRIVYTEAVKTMGVGIQNNLLTLVINPKFVEELKFNELTAVLVHEVWHVTMNHLDRQGTREPKLWNIACDIAINQFITGLPQDCLSHTLFNLPEKLSAEQYYDALFKIQKKVSNILAAAAAKPGVGNGNGQGTIDSHEMWKEMTANEREIVKQNIEQASKSRGTVPAGLESAVEAWLKPPKIPWQHVLRHYIHGSIKAMKHASWKRPNRRFGEGIKGRAPSRISKIIIAVDTSGSVSNAMLQRFMSEMSGIQKHYPTDITVIECDANVSRVSKLIKGRPYDGKFTGRGGTDFEPVFTYVKEHSLRPDLLVYLTDGCCPFPKETPPYSVIWAVENSNFNESVPFGRVLLIEEDEEEK